MEYNLFREGRLHKAFIIPKEEKEINKYKFEKKK